MLTIITGQPLPNFIPVNEASTRPEVLHCIHTPGKGGMDARLTGLQQVIARTHADIEIRRHPIDSAYDPNAVHELGKQILSEHTADEWTLNATAGTKLMSSPLERLFHDNQRRVIYVDTEQGRLVEVSADWSLRPQPFPNILRAFWAAPAFGRDKALDRRSADASTREAFLRRPCRLRELGFVARGRGRRRAR
jgi:hypothetical protein